MKLLVNIDVGDLEKGTRFYCDGLGLRVGRHFGDWLELLGAGSPIYLLPKAAGSAISPVNAATRSYDRHWTPVHLDFEVEDLPAAVARAESAGATVEEGIATKAWGSIALLADPFGNGFCLLEFRGRGYDEITL